MIKEFTSKEFYNSTGCWITKKSHKLKALIDFLSKSNTQLITFKEVLNSPLVSIQDKKWWIFNSLNLTLKEKQILALESAKSVAHIYNNKYTSDKRISLCINITARYLKGLISLKILLKYKKDAYAAYAAAYAAANAAYATYADANVVNANVANANVANANAAYATYAAAYAAYATYAAADTAYAADANANAADANANAYTAAAYAADAANANANAYAADTAYAADANANAEKLIKIWIKTLNSFE